MAALRNFGEKVRDTVEEVKDKITGNTDDNECRGRDCRDDGGYGGQCREGINREPGLVSGELRQPGDRVGMTREPGFIGNESREQGAFGGQLAETGVIGGPYGETGDCIETGRAFKAERRDEL